MQGGDWSRAPARPGKGVMEAQVGWGSPQEAGTPPSICSRAPSSPWGPSLSSSPSFVLSPVSWVLFIKHKPRQGPPPGKQRSQPPRLRPVFPGPSLLRGPQCGGPARGRCADAHVSVASPLPPPGGVSRLPSVISLLSVSAIRMPRVYSQAPAPAGPAEGLLRGPGHGFAARSPAEHPQQNRRAADPGLGRRLRPLVPLVPRGSCCVTIFPLPGRRVDDAKEFVTGDGLGVQVHGHRLPLQVLVGLVQRPEYLHQGGATHAGLRGRAPGPNPAPGPPCKLTGPLKTHGQKSGLGPALPWRHAGAFASPRQYPGPRQAPCDRSSVHSGQLLCQSPGKFPLFLIIQVMCARWEKLPATLSPREEFLRTFEEVHVDMRVDTHTYIHSFLENWLIQFLLFKNNLK